MPQISVQDVFQQTNGGLDIITHYFPSAEASVRNKRHKFSIRDEKTPSCVLYHSTDGRYFVHDFGSGQHLDAIDIIALKERLPNREDFPTLMKIVAEKFGVSGEDGKIAKSQARYERRVAAENEKIGEVKWETCDFSMSDLRAIFADKIWDYLSEKPLPEKVKIEKGTDAAAMYHATEVCKRYHLHACSWYSIVAADKKDPSKAIVHTYYSTELYPILMFDEGQWQKFYKPKERDKAFRFFSAGKKPENYVFGQQQCTNAQAELQPEVHKEDDDDDSDKKKKASRRLPEIILCSGGSDALNVAALGYQVAWLNSESAKLSTWQYARLRGLCERLYLLNDIDESGLKASMELCEIYFDLYMIELPKELLRRRDVRGNACKDVRDFFRYWRAADFKNLLSTAFPMRFWDEELKTKRDGTPLMKGGRRAYDYKPNNELMYNFLAKKGFGLYEMPSEKKGEVMVQVRDNIVTIVKYAQVNRFLKNYLRQTNVIEYLYNGNHLDLLNAFHRSPNFSETSLSNLPYVELEFQDFGRDFQYLFFQNEVWRVEAEEIKTLPLQKCKVFVWENEVRKHDVELLPPFWEVVEATDGGHRLTIKDKRCLFLQFAINASRVHWRKELEDVLDSFPDPEAYKKEYQFALDGPLLSEHERWEQEQHLLNKITSFGYLLHHYKDPARAWAVWAIDYHIPNTDDSNGGTGKSLFYSGLHHLLTFEPFEGRNTKLTQNPHIFENVTEHTDLLFVDDAYKYFDFDFFYSLITGFMKVNPKGTSGYFLEASKSPKLLVTSNFPPSRNDKATRRRMWFTAFSDYYHKNPNGEYREERLPVGEFGKSLFNDFTPEEWNFFFNFAAQALQLYLRIGQVEPPMETLILNQLKNEMGQTFHAWADTYFSAENDRLDCLVPRYIPYEEYKRGSQPQLSPQGFMNKLTAWCRYNGYTLNPETLLRASDKRISRTVTKMEFQRGTWVDTGKKESVEMLYIQTDYSHEPHPEKIRQEGQPKSNLPF